MTLTPAQLAKTHAAAFLHHRSWSAEEFGKLLKSPGMILRGDARSFLLGRVILDEAEVLTVATRPAEQGRGLASRHLASFLSQAAAQGARLAFLEVADSNEAAKRLYLKQGFAVSGRRRDYYRDQSGQTDDALVMQVALPRGGLETGLPNF